MVCAYRLPGQNTPNLQDFADDGEFGAGRVILQVLKEEKLMNVVIFMIRHYGGIQLGPSRFDMFRNVACSAVTALRKRLADQKAEEEKERKEQQRKDQLAAQQIPWASEPAPSEDWSTAVTTVAD